MVDREENECLEWLWTARIDLKELVATIIIFLTWAFSELQNPIYAYSVNNFPSFVFI